MRDLRLIPQLTVTVTPNLHPLPLPLVHTRPPKSRPQHLPTLPIIPLLHLPTLPQPPLRHPNHQATLKHKCHAPLPNLHRLQLRPTRLLMRRSVRPMPRHHIMQRRAGGLEPPARLGVVLAVDEAHELGHGVAVVPRRAERIFRDQPARRENDKVCDGGARHGRRRREHRVDGGIRVVEGDGAQRVEAREVVLVRVVCAVPGDDVEGGVILRGGEEVARELAQDGPPGVCILVEGGDGDLEVARVGQPVGADGAQLRQREVPLVELEDVAADGAVGQLDAVLDAAGDDCDFVWADEEVAELCADVEDAVLGDDEEVAVGGGEGLVGRHAGARGVDEDAEALLHGGVACAGDEVEGVDPVDGVVEVEGVPSELVGDVVDFFVGLVFRVGVVGGGFAGLEVAVAARGEDAVEPCLLVGVARGGECGARELFGVEPVGGVLGGVCADGQSAWDGFGPGGSESVWLDWGWSMSIAGGCSG